MTSEQDNLESKGKQVKQDLEERLIAFAINIIRISEGMPRTPVGVHLSGQLLRSGTSPALNYAEAVAAESHREFTHKIKIALKEVRETWVNLRITHGAAIHAGQPLVLSGLKEANELVAIFTASVKTAERKSPPRS